ncbi:Phosphoribosyl-ATP pyrophosphatase [Stieleria bergensis]|uniref:Phosphoribosyl-ATP pyrophosphatase n=1 Tax=Stieleria bergensis TaxID=2528025 RepID=A0A517SR78_9BACT|nr:MAG: phosphoribosyl-ATP diphosphatase [Rhodopirellula sp. TMED11]QDT58626.1 Phosphoribosyl-ATP pyrophosphatase [Planctomycetes bacterium SV_7m_r]
MSDESPANVAANVTAKSSDVTPDAALLPLVRLMDTLAERAETRPAGSYTTKLMEAGTPKIGRKILEEAGEMIEAADESGDPGREHFVYEAGDLIYHAMVLLAYKGVRIEEVAAELARREGRSGLDEKASRNQA